MDDPQENLTSGQGEAGQTVQGLHDPCDRLQLFFLGRLERLIYLKNSYDMSRFNGGWLKRALDRCIYSTLRDCIEANAGEQARAILRQEHQRN